MSGYVLDNLSAGTPGISVNQTCRGHSSSEPLSDTKGRMKITRIHQVEGIKRSQDQGLLFIYPDSKKETKLDDQFIQRALHDPSEPAEDGPN